MTLSSRPHRPARRRAGVLAVGLGLATALAACGSDDPSATASSSDASGPVGDAADLVTENTSVVVANSAGTVSTNGPQRVMVALLGDGPNDFLGGADAPATFVFSSEDGSVTTEAPGQWLSTAGVSLGLYVTHVTFPSDGVWVVKVKGADEAEASFNVAAESAVPEIGDPAPPSQTATAPADGDLTAISTDPSPEPAFYQLSVADAVNSGKPTVVVFATPAFCQTAVCGPTVDVAKTVAATHPDVQFVHVEPYDVVKARTGDLTPIDAMADWNLQTEPWVFVIDAEGKVAASFEGVMGADELSAALDEL